MNYLDDRERVEKICCHCNGTGKVLVLKPVERVHFHRGMLAHYRFKALVTKHSRALIPDNYYQLPMWLRSGVRYNTGDTWGSNCKKALMVASWEAANLNGWNFETELAFARRNKWFQRDPRRNK